MRAILKKIILWALAPTDASTDVSGIDKQASGLK